MWTIYLQHIQVQRVAGFELTVGGGKEESVSNISLFINAKNTNKTGRIFHRVAPKKINKYWAKAKNRKFYPKCRILQ